MTYKQFKNTVESMFNRIERRILKGGLRPHEEEFMENIFNYINNFNKGYLPELEPKTSQSISDSTESSIMDMFDDIGIGYFVMMNSKYPMQTIGLFNIIEDGLSLIELIEKDYFIYDGEQYEIIYDDSINVVGKCLDDSIIINCYRASEQDNGVLKTILHELVHFVINKKRISGNLLKHDIRQFEELICETIAINDMKYGIIGSDKYEVYI